MGLDKINEYKKESDSLPKSYQNYLVCLLGH